MSLPSVTQVLSPFSDFSGVRPEVLEHAAARGTKVHAVCAAYAQGLWVPKLDPEVQPYFDSFRRWFDAMVDGEANGVELEVISKAHGYVGHLDLAVSIRGDEGVSIIDIKTPATKNRLWSAQLAAYRVAYEEHWGRAAIRVASLRLKKDGSRAIFDEYTTSAQDFAAFLSALNAYRWFAVK